MGGPSASEPGGADSAGPFGNLPTNHRGQLGDALDELATEISDAYEELADIWPLATQNVGSYWAEGLEAVKNYAIRCRDQLKKCQSILLDRSEPLSPAARAQLDTTLRQLDHALREARRDTLAGMRALESSNDPALQADLYEKAIDQLHELGLRCTGLAMQMRGEGGLPER